MTVVYALSDVIARPGTSNPGGGGVSSGPWFWIGLVFIVLVAGYVAFRQLSGRRNSRD